MLMKGAAGANGQPPSQQQIQNFINQKNQQQIDHTLQNSANVLNTAVSAVESANGAGSQTATNLNNSTASASLNVYKPTFIINNSYQPDNNNHEQSHGKGEGADAKEAAQAEGAANNNHMSKSSSNMTAERIGSKTKGIRTAAERERNSGQSS